MVPVPPKAEALRRPSPLRTLTNRQPGSPQWALGLRAAAAITVPLAAGLAAGRPDVGTIAGLGALNVSLADGDGARSVRAVAMVAATVCNALAIFIGTLLNQSWAAIPVMAALGFASGMSSLYGNAARAVGFVSVVMFMIGAGLPTATPPATERLLLCLASGAWAMLLALALWPVRPFTACERALADCYHLNGALFAVLRERLGGGRPTSVSEDAEVVRAAEARRAIEDARNTLGATRSVRFGANQTGRTLISLAGIAEVLLQRAEGLGASVKNLGQGRNPQSSDLRNLERSLRRLADSCRSVAHQLGPRITAAVISGPVERALEAVELAHDGIGHRQAAATEPIDESPSLPSPEVKPLLLELQSITSYVTDAAALAARLRGRTVTQDDADAVQGFSLPSTPPSESRISRLLSGLRQNLTMKSTTFRHALRFSVVSAAALGTARGVGIDRAYWVTLTVAVILQPYIGATIERALLRVLGTCVGAVIAAVISSVVHQEAATIAIIAALAITAIAIQPLNYGYFVIFLTPLVILIITLNQHEAWTFAGQRVLDTLLGGGFALVGAYLLWPRLERKEVREHVANAVAADARFLSVLVDSVGDNCSATSLVAAHREAGLGADNVEAEFERVLLEPGRNHRHLANLWSIVTANRDMFEQLAALEGHLQRPHPPLTGLSELLEQLSIELGNVRHRILVRNPSPIGPEPPGHYQRLGAMVDELGKEAASEAVAATQPPANMQTLGESTGTGPDLEETAEGRDLAVLARQADRVARASVCLERSVDALVNAVA